MLKYNGVLLMKNKKLFLICMILLAIFTLGVVCAEDNATSGNYTIENTHEYIVSGENIANENNIKESVGDKDHNSYYSSNSTLENNGENQNNDLADYYLIYSLDPIYPWSWSDSDGDSGPGIDIYLDTYGRYNITGNTTIYLNDKIIDEIPGEFHYLINEDTLWNNYHEKGTYTVKVVYSGDDNFKPTNITSDFILSTYICNIENDIVYVTLPSYVSGDLTIKVNEKNMTRKRINATYAAYLSYSYERYKIELDGLKNGENYTVEVDFKGDSEKYSFAESFSIISNKIFSIDIFLIDDNGYYMSYRYHNGDYYYGEDNFIIFSVPKDMKNNVAVTIDGKSYNYTKINGDISSYGDSNYDMAFKVNISALKGGFHSIVVSYPGDSKYPSDFRNVTINILTEIKFYYDNYPRYSLHLPSDAKGNFTVEIRHNNESDYILYDTVELKGQKAIILLPCGEYDLKAYYTGDDYEVEEISWPEYVSPMTIVMNYGQNKQLKMPTSFNSTIAFDIDLDDGHRWQVGEFAVLNYDPLYFNDALIDELINSDEAKRKITQNYDDYGSYFLEFTPIISYNIGYFELHPIKVNFNHHKLTGAKDIEIYYGDSKTISLKVYDICGKLVGKDQVVKIKIGKNTFSVKTDKNGVAKLKIPSTITSGKYTITMTYKSAKVTKKLTVKQVVTLKAIKVKKSAKKLVLQATLKKGKKAIKNAKVTFKFNGKTYKAKTNKYGIAKQTIKKSVLKKLKTGKKLTYSATYLKNTVKKTVKIRK